MNEKEESNIAPPAPNNQIKVEMRESSPYQAQPTDNGEDIWLPDTKSKQERWPNKTKVKSDTTAIPLCKLTKYEILLARQNKTDNPLEGAQLEEPTAGEAYPTCFQWAHDE